MARTKTTEAKITKTGAVKMALEALGKEALPGAIQAWVATNHGMTIDSSHISNIKTGLLKGKGKRRRNGATGGMRGRPAAKAGAAKGNGWGNPNLPGASLRPDTFEKATDHLAQAIKLVGPAVLGMAPVLVKALNGGAAHA